MTSKLFTLLLAALAGGALVAGCGSSSTSTTTSTQSGGTTITTHGGGTSSATTPAPLTPTQAKQAATTCKQGIQKEAAIPTSAKGKLEKTCEKVASGGSEATLRKVAEEACIQLVDASHIPAGAARTRALSVCKVNTSVSK
jgi:hypothetical protein